MATGAWGRLSSCSKAFATGAGGRSLEGSSSLRISCSELKFETDGMDDEVAGEDDDGRGEREVFMVGLSHSAVRWGAVFV